ncbi:MAG: YggT family protein [Candidatus Pacebacteria bacterium]|nr:YggT family protein [Candidatus Paceibacterota bacterium]
MNERIIVQNTSATASSAVKPLYRGTQIAWYIFYVIEALLLFRFLLKLLAANSNAGFTEFIYTISGVFVAPFRFVFRTSQAGASVFEWSTLLAMLVYWVLVWGIIRLIVIGKPVTQGEARAKLDNQDVA